MIFITYLKNILSLEDSQKTIDLLKGDSVCLESLSKQISADIEPLVNEFVAKNKESKAHSYYFKNMSYHLMTSDSAAIYDKEIHYVNEEYLVRNFSVIIYLSSGSSTYFPVQDYKVDHEVGAMLISPTSFMYPRITTNHNEGSYYLKLNYYLDKTSHVWDYFL